MRTLACTVAAAALLLGAPAALAHEGNPNYRSVVGGHARRQRRRRLGPELRRPPAAAQHQRPGRHDPRLQGQAVRAAARRRHGPGQHELEGLLPQRGPPGRDRGARRTCRPSRSGRRSRAAGASSGTTTARTGWARATRRSLKDKDVQTKIYDWEVPVAVGDQKGAIAGTLIWVPLDDGPLPLGAIFAFAGLVIALSLVVFFVRRRRAAARRAPRRSRGVVTRARARRRARCSPLRRRRSRTRRCSDRARARREARHGAGAGRVPLRRGGRGQLRRAAGVRLAAASEVQTGKAFHPGGKGAEIAVRLARPRRRHLHGDLPRRLGRRPRGVERLRLHRRRGRRARASRRRAARGRRDSGRSPTRRCPSPAASSTPRSRSASAR